MEFALDFRWPSSYYQIPHGMHGEHNDVYGDKLKIDINLKDENSYTLDLDT